MSIIETLDRFCVDLENGHESGVTDIVLTDLRYFEFVRVAVRMLRYSKEPITAEMIKNGPWRYRNVRIRRAPYEVPAMPGDIYTAGADFTEFIEELNGARRP